MATWNARDGDAKRRHFSRVGMSHAQGSSHSAPHQVRFLILSRQRSASTTLVRMIDEHPNATCLMELLNPGGPKLHFLSARLVLPNTSAAALDQLRTALSVTTHADAMQDLPGLMERFWRWCPHTTCGFKVFDGHVRPPASLGQLLGRAPRRPRLILLERENVTAEHASWQQAVRTGNWGRTPLEQRLAGSPGTIPRPLYADSVSLARFREMHASWFLEAEKLAAKVPTLRLTTEEMLRSPHGLARTRSLVYQFLGLDAAGRRRCATPLVLACFA